jgi:hypothetical protein
MSVSTEGATTAASSSIPGSIAEIPNALAEPAVKAGRHAYDQLGGAVGWYFEHLEDLVHEARASRSAAREKDAPGLADVLAILPEAKLLSNMPGRARIRVPAIKGRNKLAAGLRDALAAVPGVTQLDVNPLTANVLVIYNAAQLGALSGVLQAVAGSGEPKGEVEPAS